MAKPIEAVTYLRVSGRGQVDGDGFPRQRAAVERFAKAQGFRIVDEYRDEGVSGTNELADRPALARMIDRLESNGVRIVLVERADRLARDLVVGELILDELRRAGVRVIAADGTELTADGDPTRTLIRQVLGAVAEYDKTVSVAKLRAARDRMRRREGRCEGRKPFGYRPSERVALDRIRDLRRKPRGGERPSFAAVASLLNAEGVPTRTGKPWAPETVRRIVRREFPSLAP
jgi:DNA invertase Pin-like site-specific DNA recombinase